MPHSHYYSKEQESELREKEITVRLADDSFELFSASGVFSKDRLDKGTRLLIDSVMLKKSSYILDLGCGIGTVGIALLRRYPDAQAMMSDVNQRALLLAQKNVKRHGLSPRTKVLESDVYNSLKKERFDAIILNPPQTAGRDVCLRMIKEAPIHLNSSGILYLVARPKKGGKLLSEKMAETFGNVNIISSGSGFRVYASRNKS